VVAAKIQLVGLSPLPFCCAWVHCFPSRPARCTRSIIARNLTARRDGDPVHCFIAAGVAAGRIFEGLGPDFAAVHWTPRFIGALLWSVLGLSIGAIFLLFALIRRNDATQVTSLMYLTPPTTAIMAWLMFGEAFNALGIAGMALAVTGVILWSRNLKKRDRMISSPPSSR
jgi:drug/metabolite transporter (DMT)-like permease